MYAKAGMSTATTTVPIDITFVINVEIDSTKGMRLSATFLLG